jgi:hypothetical protein
MTWCDTKAGTPKTFRLPPENRCRASAIRPTIVRARASVRPGSASR